MRRLHLFRFTGTQFIEINIQIDCLNKFVCVNSVFHIFFSSNVVFRTKTNPVAISLCSLSLYIWCLLTSDCHWQMMTVRITGRRLMERLENVGRWRYECEPSIIRLQCARWMVFVLPAIHPKGSRWNDENNIFDATSCNEKRRGRPRKPWINSVEEDLTPKKNYRTNIRNEEYWHALPKEAPTHLGCSGTKKGREGERRQF